jgi:hypothetical protein
MMRIRLTFATEDDLMRRCHQPLRIGVLFLPSARLPEPGTACDVDWNVRGEGLVLRARGLVAGASAVEEEGRMRQGIWIRLTELPFVGPGLDTWLEAIGSALQPSDQVELAPPVPMARRAETRPAPTRMHTPSPPAPAPQLPEPSRDDDLGWLSGNIRADD